jgi:uncharacterized membrane protein
MPSNSTETNWFAFLRSNALTILSCLGIAVVVYPEVSQLVRGEPIGDGISNLLTVGLVILLFLGLKGLDWVGRSVRLSETQDRLAILALLSGIIGGCVLVLAYFPDAPAAIGLLVPTVLGALLVIRDVVSK